MPILCPKKLRRLPKNCKLKIQLQEFVIRKNGKERQCAITGDGPPDAASTIAIGDGQCGADLLAVHKVNHDGTIPKSWDDEQIIEVCKPGLCVKASSRPSKCPIIHGHVTCVNRKPKLT